MNAKQEIIDHFNNVISKPLCAKVTHMPRRGPFYEDRDSAASILTTGWDKADFEAFLESLDFEYDDGYGTQELFGDIWYEDGSWSEREEYDGSECWKYKCSPPIPAKLIRKDKEREAKLNELGI
jgi:hypothetical protein